MWFPTAEEEWGLGRGGNREVGGEKAQLECQCHSMPFWDWVSLWTTVTGKATEEHTKANRELHKEQCSPKPARTGKLPFRQPRYIHSLCPPSATERDASHLSRGATTEERRVASDSAKRESKWEPHSAPVATCPNITHSRQPDEPWPLCYLF